MIATSTGDLRQCRICLETDHPETLCSPCKCTGTAEFVHFGCQARWMLTAANNRGLVCSSCGEKFVKGVDDVPPPERGVVSRFLIGHTGGSVMFRVIARARASSESPLVLHPRRPSWKSHEVVALCVLCFVATGGEVVGALTLLILVIAIINSSN
jgi:hypothetical protein